MSRPASDDRTGRLRGRGDGLLIAAVIVGFFLGLEGAPLFDRDEGAFSEATREMFERGDFISTYLNGQPRYDKPILIYWCQAVAVALLGPRELAFRLPSAVFAALWVFTVYAFARRRLGRDTARAAAFLMATSLGVMMIGRAAIADALLNLLVTAALLDVYRYGERARRGPVLRVFLYTGLGALTKGPVALLVPGAVSLLFFASLGRWRDWLRALVQPLGWAIFLAVTLPWYVAQYLREGGPWIEGFFFKHNVDRFLDPMEGHGGAVWYYLPVALLAALPHTALLVRVLPRIRRWRADPLDRFAWSWAGFVLVFFTFAGTKLPHYIYLGIVPLFLLMGRYRADLRGRVWALLPAVLLLGIAAALPWIVDMALAWVRDPHAAAWPWLVDQMRVWFRDPHLAAMVAEAPAALDAAYVVGCLLAGILVVVLGWRLGQPAWRALIPAGLVTALCVVLVVVPSVGAIMQGPVKEAALRSRELGLPTVTWGLDNPSIGVYRRQATPDRPPRPGEAVIMKASDLSRLERYEVLYERGGIVLARIPAS